MSILILGAGFISHLNENKMIYKIVSATAIAFLFVAILSLPCYLIAKTVSDVGMSLGFRDLLATVSFFYFTKYTYNRIMK